jgi:putative transposase
MLTILSAMVSLVSFRFRRRASLELEVLALRHQVAVLHRQRTGRARLGPGDRLCGPGSIELGPLSEGDDAGQAGNRDPVAPARIPQILALALMLTPRWAARRDREIRDLILQMSVANPLWGAPRIHGEMLKLGIEVSQATVGRHMVRRHGPP